MKVSDYMVQFLIDKGITDVFGYPGGMITNFMDSLLKYDGKIKSHLTYNEQSAAFAANGYAMTSHKVGVAYATSGPGATNLITGIANAFFDSIPCLFITGQVNTFEQKNNLLCRQKGFQETDIVSIVESITKYAVSIKDEKDIKYELEKAFYYSVAGRPGPVLIDIPFNVQKSDINPEELKGFEIVENREKYTFEAKEITEYLKQAKRPVIVAGAGINIANVREKFAILVDKLKIPVVTSMIAIDVLESDNKYKFGFIGAYGHRYSNIILAKSDLIITLGSRLDTRQTGSKKDFNLNAPIIRVDIDKGELTNKINENEIQIVCDLEYFISELLKEDITNCNFEGWIKKCTEIKEQLKEYDKSFEGKIIQDLSNYTDATENITTDVGQNQVWISQFFNVKKAQRVLFSGGLGAMGCSLPMAIGAYYGNRKNTISFNGDGGLQMNIQELQFLAREKIPIKIIVLNNKSLGMIRHFQEMYFDKKFAYTIKGEGYEAPDFVKVAKAYGLEAYNIEDENEIITLKEKLKNEKPMLINISLSDTTYVFPKLAVNQPIYNQEPLINQDILKAILEE